MGVAVLAASLVTPAFAADVPQFLMLPFNASDKKVTIQRAWTTYNPSSGRFDLNHHAIDYVNGPRDGVSSWKPFDVLAAASGEACGAKTAQGGCFDSGEIMGNRVLIKHRVDGKVYYTFYNHLKSIAGAIPLNNIKNTVHVNAGDLIGVAGDSNSQGQIHLHFELLDENFKPIDPYGIKGITDQYPDVKGKNGKKAGNKSYFLTDPPQPFGAKVKPTTAPSDQPSGQPASTGSAEQTAPPTSTATEAAASGEPGASGEPAASGEPSASESPGASTSTAAPATPTSTPVPAAATLPSFTPTPSASTGGPNLIPIVVGVGAVTLSGVVLGLFALTRRQRQPLPRDRWRP
jgi:hypothetical protein